MSRFSKKQKTRFQHVFSARYDHGFSQIVCIFRSKGAGLSTMEALDKVLAFEPVDDGEELGGRLLYIRRGDQPEQTGGFPSFDFTRVRTREDVDRVIVSTVSALAARHGRKYNSLLFDFNENVRATLAGGMIKSDDIREYDEDDWIE